MAIYLDCISGFTAFWLLATSGWAVCKKRPCCLAVLAGNSVFMCALVAGKMFPLHEPVLTGWFAELAGGVIILITGGIMIYDVDRTYKESLRLKMEQQLSQVQLEARAKYGALQQEYIRGTRKQLHETRNRLTLIKHYLDTGETDKLKEYLKGLVSSTVDMENGNIQAISLWTPSWRWSLERQGARGYTWKQRGQAARKPGGP
ncbi:MAG: hypothetical protein ACLTCQ_28890 [Enterocloster bolteae]